MRREAIETLESWKLKTNRKPLIIRGARQVGKTWLMKEFGQTRYEQVAYVNFESSKVLVNIFKDNFDIPRIISALQIETGVQIEADNTLIILDEIQEAEGAITSLKYFYENAPQYHVMAAGSLLGVALHQHTSFPVGKVEFLDLYPLSFKEYLIALDQKPLLDCLLSRDWSLIKTFKQKYIELLKTYYYVGGMPEVVDEFVKSNNYTEVRALQTRIISAYEFDFSKHAPIDIVPRIRMLWNTIPAQLAKENRKFIYSTIKKGARAKDYELGLMWLVNCGLVHKVNRVSKPGMPLKAYEDFAAFKLFLVDVGLLGAMGGMDVKTILDGNRIFEEFKGAMTEQFVLQQLLSMPDMSIYYWSAERATAELDFVIQIQGEIVPIEVKSEENLQSKSLKVYCQKHHPSRALRVSMSDYREEDWLTNFPLYAIGEL